MLGCPTAFSPTPKFVWVLMLGGAWHVARSNVPGWAALWPQPGQGGWEDCGGGEGVLGRTGREQETKESGGPLPGMCRLPKLYPAVAAMTWAPRPVH